VLADIDWGNLTVAASFIAGAVIGGIVVLRVFKYVIEYLKEGTKHDDPDAQP